MSARTTLVTGASSGIGRATALLAAEQGDHVVLVARRLEQLEKVAAQCEEVGAASAHVIAADVADDEQVSAAVAEAVTVLGRLDVVLHCAGVVTYGRTEDTSAADFATVVSTNLLGTANLARHVIPVLRQQRTGALVLVGSLLGHIAVPEMTPYVVSKWGVRALARQLHIENLDMPGIRIVHVSPGSVDTPIYGSALSSAGAVNRPPPPTISAERAAAVVLRHASSRRSTTSSVQTAWSNYALLLAFRAAPAVWDRAVGPAFGLLSRRQAG
jgi:short-subunit dehydrogenase